VAFLVGKVRRRGEIERMGGDQLFISADLILTYDRVGTWFTSHGAILSLRDQSFSSRFSVFSSSFRLCFI